MQTVIAVPPIHLPVKIGEEVSFSAHGKTYSVKRIARSTWHLRDTAIKTHSRFGTAQEIAEDIGHVIECGSLPRSGTGF